MKRVLSLIMVSIMVFTLMACQAVPAGVEKIANQQPSANTNKTQSNGKKVLFVGRDGGGDAIVAKRLKEKHGLEVTLVGDKELKVEHADGHMLIYVSESVNSGKIRNIFVKTPVPVIYGEPQSTSDAGMAEVESHGSLVGSNAIKTIQIKDSKHPLAAGLQNNVDVYKDNGKMGFAVPGKEAIIVATVPNEEQKATIFAYEKGVKNVKGEPVAAREVYFYMFNGEEINQTEDGWKLFDAAVRWTTEKK
ncbi:MAG: thaumatin, pathosis-related protein [Paenibacillus sp.]|nr:thaumatin, pathosis-related protein [Paenibacillus sp.]